MRIRALVFREKYRKYNLLTFSAYSQSDQAKNFRIQTTCVRFFLYLFTFAPFFQKLLLNSTFCSQSRFTGNSFLDSVFRLIKKTLQVGNFARGKPEFPRHDTSNLNHQECYIAKMLQIAITEDILLIVCDFNQL